MYKDLECLLYCCSRLLKLVNSDQLGQLRDVILLVQKMCTQNGERPAVCDKFIAMRIQCTYFISDITPLLGKYGNEAAAEVKQFTDFA